MWSDVRSRREVGEEEVQLTGTKQMQVQLLLMAKKRKKKQMSDSAITELYQAR